VLKNAKHDTTRCQILIEMVNASNDDVWPAYNTQRKTLAGKNITANTFPKESFQKFLSTALNNLGVYYDNQNNYEKAKESYSESLKIKHTLGDLKGTAIILGNLGFIYKNIGNIPKALDHFSQSLKIQEKIGDKPGLAINLINTGAIYQTLGDNTKALEYYEKSLIIEEAMGNKEGIINALVNIGSLMSEQRNFSKAKEFLERSLKLSLELDHKNGITSSLNNLGNLAYYKGNLSEALEYFFKSLKIKEEVGDQLGTINVLHNIGRIYYTKGELIKAQQNASKAFEIARDLGYPKKIESSAKLLKDIYKKTGKYKEALEMFELQIKMKDSINNEYSRKAVIKTQLKYEYEKQAAADSVEHAKESEIKNVLLQKQTAEIKAKRNQQYALFGGLGLVIIFAGFMYNRFKITQKQKVIIESQKEIVEEQKKLVEEKQKEILDSIHYAKRIQTALTPSDLYIDKSLKRLQDKA
jgi:tetratricopeptide (TPR) repeat protein